MELVDKVCDNFDDYAQATRKSDGEPTLIRMTTHTGNMNPEFSQVDIVPDEELNTKLKFYVSTTGQIWLSLYIADSFVIQINLPASHYGDEHAHQCCFPV